MNAERSTARLVPRWWAALAIGLIAMFAVFVSVVVPFNHGLWQWSVVGMSASAWLLLVAALSALKGPRRRRDPEVTEEGARVFTAPALTVWPLLASWLVWLATVAIWCVLLVSDPDELQAPRMVFGSMALAAMSLPSLARLLSGRLHRWTLEIGPETFTYRGGKHVVVEPWKRVRRARVQRRPAGVNVELRGTENGEQRTVLLPYLAFDVPPEQLVEEITRARRDARGR